MYFFSVSYTGVTGKKGNPSSPGKSPICGLPITVQMFYQWAYCIGKNWTGVDCTALVKGRLVKEGFVRREFVKRGLVKRGLVKRRFVRRGLVNHGLVKRGLVKTWTCKTLISDTDF